MKRVLIALLASLAVSACASLPTMPFPAERRAGDSPSGAPSAPASTVEAPSEPRIWTRADNGMITHIASGATCPPEAGAFVFTGLEEAIFTDADGNPLDDGICNYQLADGAAQMQVYLYALPATGALEEMRSTFQLLQEDYTIAAAREPSEVCQSNLLRLLGLIGVPEPDAACLVFTLDPGAGTPLPSLATITRAGPWAIKVRTTAREGTDLAGVMQDAAFKYTAAQVKAISAAAYGG
jgi:hypothetical protein